MTGGAHGAAEREERMAGIAEEPTTGAPTIAPTIAVVGAGAAGLAAALALRHAVGGRYRISVFDPALAGEPVHERGRAYALAAGSRLMLGVLGVWERLAGDVAPVTRMRITDSRLGDAVRQSLLTFDEDAADSGPLAHMVEGDALIAALRGAAEAAGIDLVAAGVSAVETQAGRPARLTLTDGAERQAALVVAADGRRSPTRRRAGIGWVERPYGQAGIVATIGHARPHEGVAVQHFLPAGTFAMLPLTGNRSSIVWVEPEDEARMLVALDAEDIVRAVARRFGDTLGELTLLDTPRAFPLALGIARRFTGERLALVGDAAHVVHPLAGLGLNVGLRDVAALAEAVADGVRLGLDPAGAQVLETYERARRFDVVSTGVAMDAMNRLFSNDILPVRLARDLGAGVVERWPGLKRLLAREAGGLTGAPPRLLRGEAL